MKQAMVVYWSRVTLALALGNFSRWGIFLPNFKIEPTQYNKGNWTYQSEQDVRRKSGKHMQAMKNSRRR